MQGDIANWDGEDLANFFINWWKIIGGRRYELNTRTAPLLDTFQLHASIGAVQAN